MNEEIRSAIREKRLVSFTYHNLHRVAEPHVYGVHHGKLQLLCFQVAGESSSGGLPDWRRVDLDDVEDYKMTDGTFPGRRSNPSGKHSDFDSVIAVVD